MTVKELISELQLWPQDYEVLMYEDAEDDDEYIGTAIVSVEPIEFLDEPLDGIILTPWS